MPFTLTMPKLSPTMEAGTIVKWRVREGDRVLMGQTLFEVTTDKATVEHNSLDEGFLRKILVAEGESAHVNDPIAIFTETIEESIEGYTPVSAAPVSQPLADEVKEEKPQENLAAPTISSGSERASSLAQAAFVPEPPLEQISFDLPSTHLRSVVASPLAKKLAREKGIDLTTIKGSGPHGRIVSRDLKRGQPKGLVTFGTFDRPEVACGTYEEMKLTPMRKVIAKRLQESKTFIPHFYVTQVVRADAMVQARAQLKAAGLLSISFNDFVLRGTALALKQHPVINSGFNSVTGAIIQFKTIDISIAVSLPDGLITPILRYADYKNLGQISVEVKDLAKRAREGKLSREEYMGGSFTVSNLGMFGISQFAGIINPPQAAILSVGGIEDTAVIEEGRVIAGKTMHLTLSADHRVIDGADGAKFLKELQRLLENPAALIV